MTDLDATVRALQERITAAQRRRARAEHDHTTAAAHADAARTRLRDEFGVDTVEAARAMLATLERDLADQVDTLTALLDDLGV